MINQIYGRFQQKHDTEANWLKATNFAPLAGEVIIYDADYDAETNPNGYKYPRIKIGIWDGISGKTDNMLVSNLPFVTIEGVKYLLVDEHISAKQINVGENNEVQINNSGIVINGQALDDIIQAKVQAYVEQAILNGEW